MTIHATQTHVDQTLTHQELSATVANAPAFQKWSGPRQTAGQSVLSTMIVRRTRLVLTASARILVLACAAWTRIVKCGIISRFAFVYKDLLEIHLHNAISQHVSMNLVYF